MENDVKKYDVVVVGSGLAASLAAINAKDDQTDVLQVMNTKQLSGASFSQYTWGLGIIGPENDLDEMSLIQSIENIGMGMTSHAVVETFVKNISKSIDDLKKLGLNLEKNIQKTIPCFDSKSRQWYGLMKDENRSLLTEAITDKGIEKAVAIEIIAIEKLNAIGLKGFLLTGLDANEKPQYYYAKSVVLATGGLSYLYEDNFASSNAIVNGQYLALNCGCALSNLEFFQWIPNYQKPIKNRIFNEYTFRDLEPTEAFIQILEDNKPKELTNQELFKLRAGHGPFTTRLASKYFDISLVQYNKQVDESTFKFKEVMESTDHTMVTRYFDWLEKETSYKKEERFQINMAAHASNGGVIINERSETSVPGLYAAGEVATAMEGADRIGGLATASAITFGRIAGKEARQYILELDETFEAVTIKNYIKQKEKCFTDERNISKDYSTCDLVINYSKKIMSTYGSIIRCHEDLSEGITLLDELMKILDANQLTLEKNEMKNYTRAKSMVTMDIIILKSMRMRKESRGSHYRLDYPEVDQSLNQPIIINKHKKIINYQLKGKTGDHYE